MPRHCVLSSKHTFHAVFEQSIKQVSACFVILVKSNDYFYPRLGMAIAKRIIAKASQRNQIKRLVRESFRLNQHRIQGIDVVVIARKQVLKHNNQFLRQCLDSQWKKLKSLCDEKSVP